MLFSNEDFMAMIEHEKSHKQFIFIRGMLIGFIIFGIGYGLWELLK